MMSLHDPMRCGELGNLIFSAKNQRQNLGKSGKTHGKPLMVPGPSFLDGGSAVSTYQLSPLFVANGLNRISAVLRNASALYFSKPFDSKIAPAHFPSLTRSWLGVGHWHTWPLNSSRHGEPSPNSTR